MITQLYVGSNFDHGKSLKNSSNTDYCIVFFFWRLSYKSSKIKPTGMKNLGKNQTNENVQKEIQKQVKLTKKLQKLTHN